MLRFLTIVIAIALTVPLFISAPVEASDEGMPSMPLIAPKKIYTVPNREAGEELQDRRGYGDQESAVRMMNLMMVGGSGYEGMSMEGRKAVAKTPSPAEGQTATDDIQTQLTPASPVVGSNQLEIDVQNKNTHQPVRGLKFKVQVFMTSMDMGTEEPQVKEVAPGKYQVKIVFSMEGPWAVRLLLPEGGDKTLNFEAGAKK